MERIRSISTCELPHLEGRVPLRRDTPSTFLEVLNWFIEYFILLKPQTFKNHPRLNFNFLRALYITTIVFLASAIIAYFVWNLLSSGPRLGVREFLNRVFVVEGADATPMPIIKAVLTYFSTVSVLWWHTTGVIREQWSHANSVYNEMLKSSDAHNLIAVSLAIDLLILDLWAHRSFCDHFAFIFEKALIWENQNDLKKLKSAFKKVNSGRYSESECRQLLENFQEYVFELEKSNSNNRSIRKTARIKSVA